MLCKFRTVALTLILAAAAACSEGPAGVGDAMDAGILVGDAAGADARVEDSSRPDVGELPLTGAVMPLEVFGENGAVRAVTVPVRDATGVDALELVCHRCGYRNASVSDVQDVKASVSINDGPFVDLSDEIAEVAEPEASFGGIDGAYHTVRMSLPADGIVEGDNELRFRFNGTDGFTMGYRILSIDVSADGESRVEEDAFREDDPAQWSPPLADASDITAGESLWYGEVALVESPLDRLSLRASCSDCHAEDGADLRYFNFSSLSIIERSRFHGLSERQGEQIASYIRSLDGPAPAQARPWNPPYQPGAGLDGLPVEEWAAGAGLEAVLDDDRDLLTYLFPGGTDDASIAASVSTRGTLNAREQPLALLLPDWNMWLPEVHPKDIWDDFDTLEPFAAYVETVEALSGGGAARMRTDPDAIRSRELLRNVLDPFRAAVGEFNRGGGAQPCRNSAVHDSDAMRLLGSDGRVPPEDRWDDPNVCERPMRALSHWSAVKHWEVMQRFGLEDSPPDVYPYGEVRGWPGSQRQVFEMAPHRIGNNSFNFVHTDRRVGSYLNTAWYQLQVILNAGNRDPVNHRPPDWKYQMDHLFHAANESGRPQPLRYVQTLIKMLQNLDMRRPEGADMPAAYFPEALTEDRGPSANGWWLTHVTPWRFVSIGGSFFVRGEARFAIWDQLEDVEPGLRVRVQNALLEAWLEKTETYEPSEFPRGGGQNNVNPLDYVPSADDGSGGVISDSGTIADGVYRSIPIMESAGMDRSLLLRLRDFGSRMWPRGDWEMLL